MLFAGAFPHLPSSLFNGNEFELIECSIQKSSLPDTKVSNSKVLFNVFFGSKLNFPFIRADTFSLAICCSLFFILSLRCWSFLLLFLAFLGCRETYFINLTFSFSFYCFVPLASLSRGCKGTSFIKTTSRSLLFLLFLCK